MKQVRLLCWVEVEVEDGKRADVVAQAEAMLDNFREVVQPSADYGVTIYRFHTADTIEIEDV